MSDERKEQRSLDSDFPGAEQLSRLYRDGKGELPPANLDAAILDAARQAVRSRPRRVHFFPSRKWVVPLSLAAALWVTLELVLQERTEMTSPRLNAPSSVMLSSESSDTIPQKPERLRGEAPPPSIARAPLEKNMLGQPKLTEPQAQQAPGARDREPEALAAEEKRGIAPTPPASRMRALQPLNQMLQHKREMTEEEADTAADAVGLQADTASEQPAQVVSNEQKKPMRELAAPTSAPTLLSDAPPAAGTVATGARKEQALSPKEWLAKIKELRRAGKTAEAEASLKAFKQRYPEYPVDKLLQEQSGTFRAPKE